MKCPYCGSENTETYYQASMPLILSACSEELLSEAMKNSKSLKRPFEARVCKECLLGFNTCKVSDEDLKLIYDNYVYISPLNGIGATKYEGMIKTVSKYSKPNSKILEIGCSEGYVLKQLKDLGYENLTGIEPGPQAEQAQKLGLNIIKDYFDENTLKSNYDVFYTMHVFEHLVDPFSIFKNMLGFLNENGRIIIEVPNFSGYFHQHLFFYNLYFMKKMCKDNSMKIVEYIIEDDDIRFVIVKENDNQFNEVDFDFDKNDFINKLDSFKSHFDANVKKIENILEKEEKIFWWGAGSCSVIYLNQIEDRLKEKITVLDGDQNKANLIIPGVNLRVNYFKAFENQYIDVLIICSSFYKEIIKTMEEYNIRAGHIEVISS